MSTKNSFSSVVDQILRAQANIINVINSLSKIQSSEADTIKIDLITDSGSIETLEVPTLSKTLTRLEQIEENVKNLSGLGDGSANVRMPDGSLRKVVVSRLPVSPERITNLSVPKQFSIKNNWFFEQFMNPLLFVTFDVGSQIAPNSTRIAVKRFIMEIDTQAKLNYFTSNLRGRNDLNYEDFLADLSRNNIGYFLDEDILDLPLNILRFSGDFDVIFIRDQDETTTSNGQVFTKKTRKYFINTLEYTDNLTGARRRLVKGDQLVVNNKNDNTRYEVETVDTTTNSITLKRIEGYDTIPTGVGVLTFYSPIFSSKQVQVPIGYDEYTAVFLKPIDPEFEIGANEWSSGVSFYTNELSIETKTGLTSFEIFYKSEVVDVGNMLLEMATNRPVPIQLGIVPTAPFLAPENFKVVPINEHRINQQDETELQRKYSEQISLQAEIKELETSLSQIKNKISTKTYKTTEERQKDVSKRDEIIREKSAKTELYNSIVLELASIGKSGAGTLADRKYRVRGFFQIPNALNSPDTEPQEIIGFEVRVRYRSKNAQNTPQERQINFIDETGSTREARFSNWSLLPPLIRERVFDSEIGAYVWKTESESDGDVVNINQIDIPITTREQVEFQVRSISEAGYPTTPLKSDWSDSIIVSFPDELENQTGNALSEAVISEESRVRFSEELRARGLDTHLAEQVTINDKTYTHTADSIDSGERTTEGNVRSLRAIIVELTEKINNLQATIASNIGSLRVSILDENGNVTNISNNSTVRLNAGFYTESINNLTIKKGAIVTKVYNLVLENTSTNALELISYLPGASNEPLSKFNQNQVLLGFQPSDYNIRGYEKVPIGLSSVDAQRSAIFNDFITNGTTVSLDSQYLMTNTFKNTNPYQSKQVKSQFIYNRYKDVGLTEDLYGNPISQETVAGFVGVSSGVLKPQIDSGSTTYIWNGTFSGNLANGNGALTDFCIHIEHPDLKEQDVANGRPLGKILELRNRYDANLPGGFKVQYVYSPPRLVESGVQQYPLISHSEYFNLRADEVNGKKQLEYVERFNGDPDGNFIFNSKRNATQFITNSVGEYEISDTNNVSLINASQVTHSRKLGFLENDQYLVGKNTCGAYLFTTPADYESVRVNGSNFLARKQILIGSGNVIKIPIIFQYRMTDFDGAGTSGTGNLGGLQNTNLTNLTYTKKIGFDIWVRRDEVFSFDVEVTAKYKPETSVSSANFEVQNTSN